VCSVCELIFAESSKKEHMLNVLSFNSAYDEREKKKRDPFFFLS